MNFLRVLLFGSLLFLGGAIAYNFFFLEEEAKVEAMAGGKQDFQTADFVELAKFDRLDLGGSFHMIVQPGVTPQMKVMTKDPSLNKLIKMDVRGNTLHVDLKRGWTDKENIQLILETPELDYLSVSGTSVLELAEPIKRDNLTLRVNGAAHMEVKVEVDELDLKVSGSGVLKIQGTADKVDAHLSGASQLTAKNLEIEHLDIHASGAATARTKVATTLEANASGASNIYVKGNPQVHAQRTSGVAGISINP